MLRVVLIFTHIPTSKYKLVDPTLCVKLFSCTHYAHICACTLLINEGPEDSSALRNQYIIISYHGEHHIKNVLGMDAGS